MRRYEIRSLTGIRGVAAVLVMIYHFTGKIVNGHYSSEIGRGYLAVDLFFILSGFVMALVHGEEFSDKITAERCRAFFFARFARVYPLYILIVLLLYFIATASSLHVVEEPNKSLLSNVFLVQQLGVGLFDPKAAESLSEPAWSISTELAAYILFPLLIVPTLVWSLRSTLLVTGLSLACVFGMSHLSNEAVGEPWRSGALDIHANGTLWPVLRCIAEFTIGLSIYRLANEPAVRRFPRSWPVDVAICVGLLLAMTFDPSDCCAVILFALLIVQLCTDGSYLARILSSPVPHTLGRLSYSIYLIHGPFAPLANVIGRRMAAAHVSHPWTVSLAILSAVVIACSATTFNLIEKPLRTMLSASRKTGRASKLADAVAYPRQ